jgi:hypothetical protein
MSVKQVVLITALAVGLLSWNAPHAGAVPSGTAERKALVVFVTWAAGSGSPAAPADRTLASVTDAVGVTAKAWYKSVSRNYFPGWSARGVGPVIITTPFNDDCGGRFQNEVLSRAKAAAKAKGSDPANFSTTVVYFSRSYCPWPGLSDGKDVWLNGNIEKGVVVQELGHTLQLGHGLALRCRDDSNNIVPLSNKCVIVRYGDPFNAMGSGEGSFSGIQQYVLGWLTGRVATASAETAQYSLAPIESAATTLQVLKVPDGDGTLWIEYRRPIGVDSRMLPGTEGVQIRRQMPRQGYKSILLDMTPTDDFWDARLAVGQSFTSPYTKVRITVESATEVAATLTLRPTTTSKVPNVVDYTESQAKSTLQTYNYVPKVAYQVDDPACEYVNLVIKQSPTGGTVLATGSTVTIYVGKAPAGGCDL